MPEEPESVREFDNAIVTNSAGDVLLNSMQQDMRVFVHRFADATIEIWVQSLRPGSEKRLFIPRYDPSLSNPTCRHCGEEL